MSVSFPLAVGTPTAGYILRSRSVSVDSPGSAALANAAGAADTCATEFKVAPSGLSYCDAREGTGPSPAAGSLIRQATHRRSVYAGSTRFRVSSLTQGRVCGRSLARTHSILRTKVMPAFKTGWLL